MDSLFYLNVGTYTCNVTYTLLNTFTATYL